MVIKCQINGVFSTAASAAASPQGPPASYDLLAKVKVTPSNIFTFLGLKKVTAYLVYKEPPPEDVVKAVALSMDAARENGVPDVWIPASLVPHASYLLLQSTEYQHQEPSRPKRPAEEEGIQSTPNSKRQSTLIHSEAEQESQQFLTSNLASSKDARTTDLGFEQRLQGFVIACTMAAKGVANNAVVLLTDLGQMIHSTSTASVANVEARAQQFVSDYSSSRAYKQNPNMVYVELAAIALAAVQSAAAIVNPTSIAQTAITTFKRDSRTLANKQPNWDTEALAEFEVALLAQLEKAMESMKEKQWKYNKTRPPATFSQRRGAYTSRGPGSYATSPGSTASRPIAFAEDGRTPLSKGLCFFVRNGKCTRPGCPYPPEQHDYKSKGAQYQAPDQK